MKNKVILAFNYNTPKEGWIVYDGLSYKLKDESGVFDVRYGSINISEHRDLNTLTHEISETSYDDITYGGGTSGTKVSKVVTYKTSSKLHKIRQAEFTYLSDDLVMTVETQYDNNDIVTERVTESYSYSGTDMISVERTRNV